MDGFALPGESLFIMGASGAGKTTLLNLLSDRAKRDSNHKFEGKININEKIEFNNSNFGSFAAYVMQDDVLFDIFTPKEALTFAARLRLPESK